MKKRILAMLLAGAMCVSIAGCSSTGGTTEQGTDGGQEDAAGAQYHVSVILKTLSAEYWQYVKSGAEAYAAEHPDEISVDVKGPSSETAFDEMQNMIETDMNSGYDGLIISPLQSDTAAQQVSGAEFPIVALDTNFEAPEVVSFVGTGNEEAAKQGAIAAVAAAEEAGWETIQCIEIAGVQGDETNTARMNGYMAGIEEAGGDFLEDEVQYADAVATKAVDAMNGIMSRHPEGIAIICANNDDMAIAAAKAAADSGNEAYANTIFLGFDGIQSACDAILEGRLTMSVAQQGYEMGYMAVEAVVNALNGETIEEFIDSGADVVTADNAQERKDTLQGYLDAVA